MLVAPTHQGVLSHTTCLAETLGHHCTCLSVSMPLHPCADEEEEEDEDFDAGGEDMSASSGGSLDEEVGR